MIARTHACSFPGINAVFAAVKAAPASGLPGISMVGPPDDIVKESRDRVKQVAGCLPMAMQAKDSGCGDGVLPAGNAREASMLMDVGGPKTECPPSVPGPLNSFLHFPFAPQTIFAKLSNISAAVWMIQDCGRKTQFHACT